MDQYKDFFDIAHISAGLTTKSIKNNIDDYKTCIEYHNFKKENLYTEKIKERYNEIDKIKQLIKNCKNNNLDKTSCYYNSVTHTQMIIFSNRLF